jgi:hypothetical protein
MERVGPASDPRQYPVGAFRLRAARQEVQHAVVGQRHEGGESEHNRPP